jgi:hypothetical protein
MSQTISLIPISDITGSGRPIEPMPRRTGVAIFGSSLMQGLAAGSMIDPGSLAPGVVVIDLGSLLVLFCRACVWR